jgi:hypothetical protein
VEIGQVHDTRNGTRPGDDKEHFVNEPRIVDRGDGPKIAGTRITVYTILD